MNILASFDKILQDNKHIFGCMPGVGSMSSQYGVKTRFLGDNFRGKLNEIARWNHQYFCPITRGNTMTSLARIMTSQMSK